MSDYVFDGLDLDEIDALMKAQALTDAEESWNEWAKDSLVRFDVIARGAYIAGFMHSQGWFKW